MAKTIEQLNTVILLNERYRDRCKSFMDDAVATSKYKPGSTAMQLLEDALERAEARVTAAKDQQDALLNGRKYHCFRPVFGRMLCVKCGIKYGGLFDESQCHALDKASNYLIDLQ